MLTCYAYWIGCQLVRHLGSRRAAGTVMHGATNMMKENLPATDGLGH
jgi:hypothetical protein